MPLADMGVAIADHVRAAEVDVQLPGRTDQHARFRLAAVAQVFGSMRAEVDFVHARVPLVQVVLHQLMHLVDGLFLEVAPRNTRLIRCKNRFHSARVYLPDRFSYPWEQPEETGMI